MRQSFSAFAWDETKKSKTVVTKSVTVVTTQQRSKSIRIFKI